MTAVADASPLCYLILIGEIELLPKLFGRVAVPEAVIAELLHQDAPKPVRLWASNLPEWIDVHRGSDLSTSGLEKLHVGERAAIALAEKENAEIMVLDEKSARRAAVERGLRVTGTLGVLGESAILGLVDLPAAITRLSQTNFRCSPALLKAALDRARA